MSGPGAQPVHILVYSSNARTREQVRLALGRRVHPELPELTYTDVATGPMVIQLMDRGGFDLVILDGEAAPVGGMGIAKQLKDEIRDCPPVLVSDRPRRRRVAGQLVAGRGRRAPSDRPDPAGRGGRRFAAHAGIAGNANYTAALALSQCETGRVQLLKRS